MNRLQQRGGVSLFIVIFTMLIITIVTVSFTQIMTRNQKQATANDLSQRAYDSALAGVEDAKRTLVALQQACTSGSNEECNNLKNAVNSDDCDTLDQAGISGTSKNGVYQETRVGALSDNQAYTCVKIDTKTANYEGFLGADESTVVPLVGDENFNRVKITWFTHEDSGQSDGDQTVKLYSGMPDLPPQSVWGSETPSLMRAQYIPGSVSTSSLDGNGGAKTAFLYPSSVGVDVSLNAFTRRNNNIGTLSPSPISCTDYNLTVAAGSCSATLILPGNTQRAYLQLTALYNATHFTVELYRGATHVDFDGVQPKVDSTGRAAELFRRVIARVKVSGVSLPYPNASVTTKGNFCKDFSLRDSDGNEYQPSTTAGETCDPSSTN